MKNLRLLLALAFASWTLTCAPAAEVAAVSTVSDGIQVKDYTLRNGGDDTAGILAAIAAFEAQTKTDVLDFGDGVYYVGSATPMRTHTASSYMLALGLNTDLAGRNVRIAGKGAHLFFEPGPAYRTMFWAVATFKSLEVSGITFEKSATLQTETFDEPSGRDLLLVGAKDGRVVDSVKLHDCTFINGFRACTAYGNGNDLRDKLKYFEMSRCTVLNPYGVNIAYSGGATSYGGGQQLMVSAWAEHANVTANYANGGWNGATRPAACPSGVVLDGFYFSSPRTGLVTGNVCVHHGVEAFFQIQANTYLDTTDPFISGFTVPAVNENVDVLVSGHTAGNYADHQTTWTVAQRVYVQGTGAFEVVGYDVGAKRLTLKNKTATAGVSAAQAKIIYDDKVADSSVSFVGNSVDMTQPAGAYVSPAATRGIVSNTRANITGNLISGAGVGVQIYSATASPVRDDTRGSIISGNTIRIADTTAATVYHYGILAEGDAHRIASNVITTPVNRNFGGIIVIGNDCDIAGNSVFATTTKSANGYSNIHRGVGIGTQGSPSGTVFTANRTGGFDVGLGSIEPVVLTFAVIQSHTDTTSALPIDTHNPNLTLNMVDTTARQTLTNKTLAYSELTAPRLADGGYLADANGNQQLIFKTISGAVNEFTMTNAATGGPVRLQATGEANVSMWVESKGYGEILFRTNGITRGIFTGDGTLALNTYLKLPAIDYALWVEGAPGTNLDLTGRTWRFNISDTQIMEVHADGVTATKVTSQSDVVSTESAKGLVLKSPNGHYWRFTVSDSGVLSPGTDLGTSPP